MMDEFQSRRQGKSVFKTQQNLAKQPYIDADNDRPASESNVVELPGLAKKIEADADVPSTPRKSTTKRKSPATSSKTRAKVPATEVGEHPFAAELKQLEAQAARINHLLQEHSQKQATASSVQAQTPHSIDTTVLQAYADRIKRDLAALERAMRLAEEGISSAAQAPQLPGATPAPITPEAPPAAGMPPSVSPWLPPGQRQQTLQTAELLRYLANQGAGSVPGKPTTGLAAAQRRRPRSIWYRLLGVPRRPLDRLVDAVLWILGAIVLRLGCKQLLIMVPAVAPAMNLLLLLPAVVAVVLALLVPKAGSTPVYRLFLVSIGLFLGGRL